MQRNKRRKYVKMESIEGERKKEKRGKKRKTKGKRT
jgi:hypothetical protein